MKIYIAARYQRREEMLLVAKALDRLGHTVVSRWINGHTSSPAKNAQEDLDDIRRADAMILFSDREPTTSGGCHVETGVALAIGKPLAIVGPRENIFHHLPQIHVSMDLEEAVESLRIRPGSYHVVCICGFKVVLPVSKGVCPVCKRDIDIEHPGPDPRASKERTITERYEGPKHV